MRRSSRRNQRPETLPNRPVGQVWNAARLRPGPVVLHALAGANDGRLVHRRVLLEPGAGPVLPGAVVARCAFDDLRHGEAALEVRPSAVDRPALDPRTFLGWKAVGELEVALLLVIEPPPGGSPPAGGPGLEGGSGPEGGPVAPE
jgi:hypothetical protein